MPGLFKRRENQESTVAIRDGRPNAEDGRAQFKYLAQAPRRRRRFCLGEKRRRRRVREIRKDRAGIASRYQPITMFDSITLRARSRSEPVSCMYSRMACTLSPAAFDRQSRAVWQMSSLPEMPSALLEITQVSRGRFVNRITRSPG